MVGEKNLFKILKTKPLSIEKYSIKKRNKKMAYSAFDQFEITRIIPLHLFGNLDISITNSTIFMVIGTGTFY
jgi:hypothetical protein